MKIKFKSNYKKSNGAGVPASDRFVYVVTGTEQELTEYKEAQGDFLKLDETGAPLFFTGRAVESGSNLTQVQTGANAGRYIADQSAATVALSTAKGYGAAVENEMAKLIAARILAGSQSTTSQAVKAVVAEVAEAEADLSQS